MFGELPKIFDRNFAIAFFLPVVTFIAASLGIIHKYGFYLGLHSIIQTDILIGTTILGLAMWLGGVILLVLNRSIYQLLEGYPFEQIRCLSWFERKRYKKLCKSIARLDAEYTRYTDDGLTPPAALRNERNRLLLQETEQFPDDKRWLLPTAFGNAIRAFEVYPRVMYGLESVQGWNRLLAVVPKSYQTQIDDAKAQTDFWVNLWLLSLLIVFEYIGIALWTRKLYILWFPFISLVFAWIASLRARNAAIEWGEAVKSAFDVFLPRLHTRMQLPVPRTNEESRQIWQAVSEAVIYRFPDRMPFSERTKLEEDKEH